MKVKKRVISIILSVFLFPELLSVEDRISSIRQEMEERSQISNVLLAVKSLFLAPYVFSAEKK